MEKSYYENTDMWDKHVDAANRDRILETLNQIPDSVDSVLDVGCGNGVLTNVIPNRHFAVGIDRSQASLAFVSATKCQADGLAIPFASKSFDMVIATEVIEHIPYYQYHVMLRELARVASKYILITVPYREDRMSRRVTCPVCGCLYHPTYHLRSFELEDLQQLFQDHSTIKLVKASGVCLKTVFAPNQWLIKTGIRKPSIRNFANTMCPQCGFRYPSSKKTEVEQKKKISGFSRLEARLEVLFHKYPIFSKKEYMWWLALYQVEV